MFKKIQKKLFSSQQPKILTQLLIDGNFVNSKEGKTFETLNPATEKVIAEVQEADKVDVDLAVRSSKEAFENGPWRKMSATERGSLMFKLADLIDKHADELALLETMDSGKPLKFARYGDMHFSSLVLRYYAGWCDKVNGQTIPVNGPFVAYTRHEPVGVCAQILPWNFPLFLAVWKMAPSLAMGCTSVVKSAEQTPLTTLRLGELALEAGFPKGVINVLSGHGPTTGAYLVEHPLVDKISFTGSTEVGLHILRNCHTHNLKRVSLELGGKSPMIILDDADLDAAVPTSADGIFFNSGQICASASRTLVHEKIYDKFVEKTIEFVKKKKVGDPLNFDVDQGAIIDDKHVEKFSHYVKRGKQQGAKLVLGGEVMKGPGYFVENTIFTDVTDEMDIAREEIFGPIQSILKFKTVDEAIARANNTPYGLAAGVFTQDMGKALKIANAYKAGTVSINTFNNLLPNTPFGGFKNSGMGREAGEYALREYAEIKTVVIKRPDDSLP